MGRVRPPPLPAPLCDDDDDDESLWFDAILEDVVGE